MFTWLEYFPERKDRRGQIVFSGEEWVAGRDFIGQHGKCQHIGGLPGQVAVAVVGHDEADVVLV